MIKIELKSTLKVRSNEQMISKDFRNKMNQYEFSWMHLSSINALFYIPQNTI